MDTKRRAPTLFTLKIFLHIIHECLQVGSRIASLITDNRGFDRAIIVAYTQVKAIFSKPVNR